MPFFIQTDTKLTIKIIDKPKSKEDEPREDEIFFESKSIWPKVDQNIVTEEGKAIKSDRFAHIFGKKHKEI